MILNELVDEDLVGDGASRAFQDIDQESVAGPGDTDVRQNRIWTVSPRDRGRGNVKRLRIKLGYVDHVSPGIESTQMNAALIR